MNSLADIISSTLSIGKITGESVDAYEEAQEILTRQVNRAILQHPDVDRLLGGNPPELIENNHLNHVAFILEVIALNDFELLARTLPWVYRAYHNQGVHYDYFKIELQAWINAIEKELESDKAVPIIALYQWMISQHVNIIELSEHEETLSNHEPSADPWSSVKNEFLVALNARDHEQCLGICQQMLSKGVSLPEICQYIVYPVMVEVGVRWENGKLSVAGEHQATAIANKVISGLYFLEEKPQTTHSTAVVTAIPGERHEMGAWIISICLELDGWDVIYLGADTPRSDIVATAEKNNVDLIALSIAMPFGISMTRKLIADLRSCNAISSAKIMVGGGLFQRFPFLAERLDIDASFNDCIEALEWLRNTDG